MEQSTLSNLKLESIEQQSGLSNLNNLKLDFKVDLDFDSNISMNQVLGFSQDICVVCGDRASGRHYGAISCEGCKGFFKRSIRKQLGYTCRGDKNCEVTKHHRNRCQYCRLQKCLQMGMHSDSVQHERKPVSNQKKGESVEETTGSLSPGSFNGVDFRNSFLKQSFIDSNSFQDDESMEETDSNEPNVIGKAVNAFSLLLKDDVTDIKASLIFSSIDKENILPQSCLSFKLVSPGPYLTNGILNVQYVCETASRLLFLSIHWARALPTFQLLSIDRQLTLAKSAWNELFAIGLVQCKGIISLTHVIHALTVHLQTSTCTPARLANIVDYVAKLQVFIKNADQLGLDDFGFAALKSLVLFSPERLSKFGYSTTTALSELQSMLVEQLSEHLKSELPDDVYAEQINKILLLLPQLKALDSAMMEELFFTNFLGSVHINSVIPYIFTMEPDFQSDSS